MILRFRTCFCGDCAFFADGLEDGGEEDAPLLSVDGPGSGLGGSGSEELAWGSVVTVSR